jgi:hypothetical protein
MKSHSTVFSVFINFILITLIIEMFILQLFRELQGIENKLIFLRRAYGTNGLKEARRCRTEKIGQVYKNFFCTAVQEDSWELAQKEYPEGCKQVERIAGTTIMFYILFFQISLLKF